MSSTHRKILEGHVGVSFSQEILLCLKRPLECQKAHLYPISALVGLLLFMPLSSDADVIYKIIDSVGNVTYADRPLVNAGQLTVIEITKPNGVTGR